jgi:hypothetical protein
LNAQSQQNLDDCFGVHLHSSIYNNNFTPVVHHLHVAVSIWTLTDTGSVTPAKRRQESQSVAQVAKYLARGLPSCTLM